MKATTNLLETTTYLRAHELVGRRETATMPASRGLLPFSSSTWWAGVANGRFPKPVKVGGMTLWATSAIKELVEKINAGALA